MALRVNCCVPYDLERVIRAYEAIDSEVPIRERRWVMIHVTEATPQQLRRMKALGVVATVNPGFMYMAADRFGLRVGLTWLLMALSFGATLALAVGFDISGLPALPLLSVAFVVANADHLWRYYGDWRSAKLSK